MFFRKNSPSKTPNKTYLFIGLFLFFIVSGMIIPKQILNYGLTSPEAIAPYLNHTLPSETPSSSSSWAVVEAFPNLTFTDPTDLIEMPYSNKFLIAEKRGQLWTFDKKDTTTNSKTKILDIESKVMLGNDAGLLGVVFHPDFGKPGDANRKYLYTHYRGFGTTGWTRASSRRIGSWARQLELQGS